MSLAPLFVSAAEGGSSSGINPFVIGALVLLIFVAMFVGQIGAWPAARRNVVRGHVRVLDYRKARASGTRERGTGAVPLERGCCL